jgi:hypothetical protein
MGPGGFRGLQTRSGSSRGGLGGFDSHTSPPIPSLYIVWICGGAWGLVVSAGFKPVVGRREVAWVGSIPTRLRQHLP